MGEILALLTALLFAVAVIFYKKAVAVVPPLALNLFKNCVALVLLALTTAGLGYSLLPAVPLKDLLLILLSGAIGIGISDTFFFMTLEKLGASRTALLDCLYSPFVILLSVVLLKENVGLQVALGGALILFSVLLSSSQNFGKGLNLSPKQLWMGMGYGAAAMATIALAIVLVKPMLHTYPLTWLSMMRMAGGVTTLLALLPLHPKRESIYAIFRPQPSWKWIFAGTFFGSYLSILTWLAGFKHSQTGVVALLNQTSTVLIVLLAWIFLKEPMTRLKCFGVIVAFLGAMIVAS